MADIGDIMGSMMIGLIRARKMADEQTAALAEYYKSNPLLEGLSVPRIRIPELTIDLPFVIEEHTDGKTGELKDPAKIADAVNKHLSSTLTKSNIKTTPAFHRSFIADIKKQLNVAKQSGAPIMKETVARIVQSSLSNSLSKTKTSLSLDQKDSIAKELRNKISAISIATETETPSVDANVKTSEVKEKAAPENVVRLKITLKEEGLEWATQASENGGVVRTLQPE